MSAHNMGWSCQGPDEILGMIGEARRCFPGLTVEPRTRNIGFGLVIDEVRVQEPISAPDTAQSTASTASTEAGETDSDGESHPMWESPVSEQRTVAVWREDYLTPMRLNLPVRVTVHHDDLQVHEVTMEFPAALLKRALGMYVDPLEMSLSEVQSAVIAPVEAGFTMRTLDGPELSSTSQEPPEDDPETAGEKRPRHRRRRILVPALVALVGVAAAGGWWVAQGRPALNVGAMPWASSASTGQSGSSAPNTQPNSQPSTQQSAQVAATQVSTSLAPVVTHAKPSETPSGKPNVTLASALAFTFNSATLSPQAKTAIGHLAQEVRSHGLTGKIYVDGYTDDLGSASHGLVLSQQRADAVSHYLGSRLVGVPVTIVSTGHGEAHPVADNKTAAGRRANRRVAITLPTS
jgi:outer membrane protein OmpA-like peptidoglycan-associated protein